MKKKMKNRWRFIATVKKSVAKGRLFLRVTLKNSYLLAWRIRRFEVYLYLFISAVAETVLAYFEMYGLWK